MNTAFLLSGHDTIEGAYYLYADRDDALDFERLAVEKELLKTSKSRQGRVIQLGMEEFMLSSHGTGSGYPFLLENDAFSIQCGPFNQPNFFVTYRSLALWHVGALELHQVFLAWAESVGMRPARAERISRVDFTFDYQLPELDFDEDNFLSQANKDNQHREHGRIQTFHIGRDALQLRVYNKSAEIEQQSGKTWFHDLWGCVDNVWRIEWQVRKDKLREFEIDTFCQLEERQGDLLNHIATEHTSLRCKSSDSNRSRWPVHPLWNDLLQRIESLGLQGIGKQFNKDKWLEGRMTQAAISVYGYMKRMAAIKAMRNKKEFVELDEAFVVLYGILRGLHDPLSWEIDVSRKCAEMRLSNG